MFVFCLTKMGSSFKKAIFEEHIQVGLVGWARMARKNNGLTKAGSSQVGPKGASPVTVSIQMTKAGAELAAQQGNAGEIQAANAPKYEHHQMFVS